MKMMCMYSTDVYIQAYDTQNLKLQMTVMQILQNGPKYTARDFIPFWHRVHDKIAEYMLTNKPKFNVK